MNKELAHVIVRGAVNGGFYEWLNTAYVDIDGFGMIVLISADIPSEEGYRPNLTFKITTDNEVTYWKKYGSFSSYDGTEWHYGDFDQVFPVTKTVTAYE